MKLYELLLADNISGDLKCNFFWPAYQQRQVFCYAPFSSGFSRPAIHSAWGESHTYLQFWFASWLERIANVYGF